MAPRSSKSAHAAKENAVANEGSKSLRIRQRKQEVVSLLRSITQMYVISIIEYSSVDINLIDVNMLQGFGTKRLKADRCRNTEVSRAENFV
jgi:hypothetical protein